MDKAEWIQQLSDELSGVLTLTPAEQQAITEMTNELHALQAEARLRKQGYLDVPLWTNDEELDV